MKCKTFVFATLLLAAFTSRGVLADQMEREAAEAVGNAPSGVMVKVDPVAKVVEVFKFDKVDATSPDAVKKIEDPANKVADFKLSTKELDRDSSTDAWYYNWYRPYWRWNSWGGYRPYYYNWYRPYYYPGYFNYGNYYYNYGYSYPYYGYNYGFYYR